MNSPAMRQTAFGQHGQSATDRLIKWFRFKHILPAIKPGAVVVDLGCGYKGELLQELGSRISRGIGIDLNVSASPNNQIVLKTGRVDERLPIEDASADVVVSLAVIEHVEDPLTMVAEAYRILKPGGLLLLTTPSLMAKPLLEFLAFRLKIIDAEEIADHKQYYTQASLRQVLRDHGFTEANIHVSSFELGMNLFAKARKE